MVAQRTIHPPRRHANCIPPLDAGLLVFTNVFTSHGIGVIANESFAAWPLRTGWNTEGRDIGWAEAVAVKLAVMWIAGRGVCNVALVIFCDNQGVELGWSACR